MSAPARTDGSAAEPSVHRGARVFSCELLLWGFVGQCEVHVDLGGDFHGFAVEESRRVSPLPNGFEGRWNQQRMTANHADVPQRAIGGDDDAKLDSSGD